MKKIVLIILCCLIVSLLYPNSLKQNYKNNDNKKTKITFTLGSIFTTTGIIFTTTAFTGIFLSFFAKNHYEGNIKFYLKYGIEGYENGYQEYKNRYDIGNILFYTSLPIGISLQLSGIGLLIGTAILQNKNNDTNGHKSFLILSCIYGAISGPLVALSSLLLPFSFMYFGEPYQNIFANLDVLGGFFGCYAIGLLISGLIKRNRNKENKITSQLLPLLEISLNKVELGFSVKI